ncbi:uncharacterized protein [Atheta coriaria]|uniref:uncharacterized protein n=1 Tax=Dalotia coriaria TaxID=877792 RepID=UPI0031F3DD07
MDSCSDIDVDMYDVIFKTIYLFLESNEFHDTATSFLAEIRRKFDKEVDTTSSNAKTLILRPYFEQTDGASGQNDENLESNGLVSHAETFKDVNLGNNVITSEDNESSTPEVNLMEEKTSEIMMQVLSPKLSQPNILQSHSINNENASEKSHNSQEIIHKSWKNIFEQNKNPVCPDCTNITRIKQDLDGLSSSSAILDPNDMNILHKSFKLLQELQENHVKLIRMIIYIMFLAPMWSIEPH